MTHDLALSLAVAVFIPVIILIINQKGLDDALNKVSVAAISAAVLYAVLLATVFYISHQLKSELASFDLNGDGFFSGDEITEEQQLATKRYIHDTGRNFAPITGMAVSFVYFLCVWVSLYLAKFVRLLGRALLSIIYR